MFAKKYVFETTRTRYRRYISNFSLLFVALGVCYFLFSLYLVYFSKLQSNLTETSFYKKAPDLIVVFTGDKGRIPLSVELSKKYPSSKVFITGVYAKNTVDLLLRNSASPSEEVDSNQFEIDYLARNTVENVISMLRFIREKEGIQKVLIISSDYHLYRIQRIVNTLNKEKKNLFYFLGTESSLNELRTFKILLMEVYKIIKAQAFLLLWDA